LIELQESQDVRAQNPALRILDGNRVRIAAIYSRIETRNSVKMIPLAFLFFAALAWAGGGSHSADYTVNVHVSSSSTDRGGHQLLDVVIDAKKYELRSELSIGYLLELGDYKAKLVKNDHPTAYDSSQVYEFLFPSKTRPYVVIGQTE